MIKRIIPLVLLAAWIPQAHAFPPCPVSPMDYGPPPDQVDASTDATANDDIAPWFKANYDFVGDPSVIGQIAPERSEDGGIDPNTGKCRDRDGLPVMNSHASAGALHLNPRYAPVSGFGVVELPYLPEVAADGLSVAYQLDFTVDNNVLQNPADWLDVAQLDFFRNGSAGKKYSEAVSSVYRVRKTQRNPNYATLEIIESRGAAGGVTGRPPVIDRVVAVIPLVSGGQTAISLRWTQTATQRDGDSTGFDEYDIDVVFEVLGATHRVLYTAELPGQWASMLSMGLLDYNVGDASLYEKGNAMEFSNMLLSAKRQY